MALRAGSDMDMESRIYERETKALLEAGKVEQAWIDDAVRRILRVKFRLGLFDDPYRYCDTLRERTWMMHPDHLAVARDAARKSMVLLKNEGALLPLSPSVKTIAVIGQLAADKDIPLGSWRAQAIANSAVSMLEGIKEAVSPQTQVLYAQGYALAEGQRDFVHELTFANDDQKGFAEAIAIAKKADVVVMALGEDCFQTGEGRSQADIRLKGQQVALFEAVRKVNPKVAVVLMNGRPLAIPELAAQAPAILEAWFGGSEAGRAIADVLFGAYNPSGKLPVSFPYHVGQEPLYYNRKNTGRPGTHDYDAGTVFWSHYTDVPNKPLFPFGHGLSYSQFQYENFRAEAKEGRISVTATVKNGSAVDGTETVQLYIRDVHASATQPVQRLVAFEQVSVPAGGSVQVSFELAKPQLGFYTSSGEFIAEDGQFVVMMGGSSADVQQATVSVSFGAKP
jgi:beta-glucosidase